MTGFLRTVNKDGTAFLSIGGLAKAVQRSPRTIRRWEQRGVIPRTKYWTLPEDPANSYARRRWYPESDVERYRRAAEESGLAVHQRRGQALRAVVDACQPSGRVETVDDRLLPKTQWSELTEPERGTRSWREIEGVDRTATALPDSCQRCGRKPTVTSGQRADGRVVRSVCCDVHGLIGVFPC
jgi:hypothetical protein